MGTGVGVGIGVGVGVPLKSLVVEPPQAVRKSAPEEHRAIVKSGTHRRAILTKERAALKRFRIVLIIAARGYYHTSTNLSCSLVDRLQVGVTNISETYL